MIKATLTNRGCESEFTKLCNGLKVRGGKTSLQTLSQKNVVNTIAYPVSIYSRFMYKDGDEKRGKQKWSRLNRRKICSTIKTLHFIE